MGAAGGTYIRIVQLNKQQKRTTGGGAGLAEMFTPAFVLYNLKNRIKTETEHGAWGTGRWREVSRCYTYYLKNAP